MLRFPFKSMVKENQSMIVALEEQLKEVSKDDDERSVIEEILTMGNNSSGHKCTNEDLKRNIKNKHKERVIAPFAMKRLQGTAN